MDLRCESLRVPYPSKDEIPLYAEMLPEIEGWLGRGEEIEGVTTNIPGESPYLSSRRQEDCFWAFKNCDQEMNFLKIDSIWVQAGPAVSPYDKIARERFINKFNFVVGLMNEGDLNEDQRSFWLRKCYYAGVPFGQRAEAGGGIDENFLEYINYNCEEPEALSFWDFVHDDRPELNQNWTSIGELHQALIKQGARGGGKSTKKPLIKKSTKKPLIKKSTKKPLIKKSSKYYKKKTLRKKSLRKKSIRKYIKKSPKYSKKKSLKKKTFKKGSRKKTLRKKTLRKVKK